MSDETSDDAPEPLREWRLLPAWRLRPRRHELLARLLALTPADLAPDALARALAGEPSAALRVVEALPPDAHPDVVGSWMAWAAAKGEPVAVLALIERLEEDARRAEAPGQDDEEDDVGDAPEAAPAGDGAARAAALRRCAASWRNFVPGHRFDSADGRRRLAAALERQRAAEEKAKTAIDAGAAPGAAGESRETPGRAAPPVRPQFGAPSLVVVRAIGETHGRDAGDIMRAYVPLTRPLPLAGGALDPRLLGDALSLEMPWLAEAVEAICDEMALRRAAGAAWFRISPLLLVGPPGCGKTRFARRLGRLAGTGVGEVPAGGASDNRLLEGTARGWHSAQPAYPLVLMRRCGAANPVIVVDEIDKAQASHNGDIRASLLGMLEPETARTWFDSCLLAACNLAEVSWILTANDAEPLPRPLRSRLRVIRVPTPGPQHFDALLPGVLRELAASLGIAAADLPELEPEAVAALRAGFARQPDVRRLQAAVARALARTAERSPAPH